MEDHFWIVVGTTTLSKDSMKVLTLSLRATAFQRLTDSVIVPWQKITQAVAKATSFVQTAIGLVEKTRGLAAEILIPTVKRQESDAIWASVYLVYPLATSSRKEGRLVALDSSTYPTAFSVTLIRVQLQEVILSILTAATTTTPSNSRNFPSASITSTYRQQVLSPVLAVTSRAAARMGTVSWKFLDSLIVWRLAQSSVSIAVSLRNLRSMGVVVKVGAEGAGGEELELVVLGAICPRVRKATAESRRIVWVNFIFINGQIKSAHKP